MIKKPLSVLLTVSASRAFAGSGNAADGLVFVLALTGVLIFIAGILFLADFIKKNPGLLSKSLNHCKRYVSLTYLVDWLRRQKKERMSPVV